MDSRRLKQIAVIAIALFAIVLGITGYFMLQSDKPHIGGGNIDGNLLQNNQIPQDDVPMNAGLYVTFYDPKFLSFDEDQFNYAVSVYQPYIDAYPHLAGIVLNIRWKDINYDIDDLIYVFNRLPYDGKSWIIQVVHTRGPGEYIQLYDYDNDGKVEDFDSAIPQNLWSSNRAICIDWNDVDSDNFYDDGNNSPDPQEDCYVYNIDYLGYKNGDATVKNEWLSLWDRIGQAAEQSKRVSAFIMGGEASPWSRAGNRHKASLGFATYGYNKTQDIDKDGDGYIDWMKWWADSAYNFNNRASDINLTVTGGSTWAYRNPYANIHTYFPPDVGVKITSLMNDFTNADNNRQLDWYQEDINNRRGTCDYDGSLSGSSFWTIMESVIDKWPIWYHDPTNEDESKFGWWINYLNPALSRQYNVFGGAEPGGKGRYYDNLYGEYSMQWRHAAAIGLDFAQTWYDNDGEFEMPDKVYEEANQFLGRDYKQNQKLFIWLHGKQYIKGSVATWPLEAVCYDEFYLDTAFGIYTPWVKAKPNSNDDMKTLSNESETTQGRSVEQCNVDEYNGARDNEVSQCWRNIGYRILDHNIPLDVDDGWLYKNAGTVYVDIWYRIDVGGDTFVFSWYDKDGVRYDETIQKTTIGADSNWNVVHLQLTSPDLTTGYFDDQGLTSFETGGYDFLLSSGGDGADYINEIVLTGEIASSLTWGNTYLGIGDNVARPFVAYDSDNERVLMTYQTGDNDPEGCADCYGLESNSDLHGITFNKDLTSQLQSFVISDDGLGPEGQGYYNESWAEPRYNPVTGNWEIAFMRIPESQLHDLNNDGVINNDDLKRGECYNVDLLFVESLNAGNRTTHRDVAQYTAPQQTDPWGNSYDWSCQQEPYVYNDGDGYTLIAFQDHRERWDVDEDGRYVEKDIYLNVFDKDDNSFIYEDALLVSRDDNDNRVPGIQEAVDIARNGDDFLIVWGDERNDPNSFDGSDSRAFRDIYAQMITLGNGPYGPAILFNGDNIRITNENNKDHHPSASYQETDNVWVVAYEHKNSDSDYEISIAFLDMNGNIIKKEVIATGIPVVPHPQIDCKHEKCALTYRADDYTWKVAAFYGLVDEVDYITIGIGGYKNTPDIVAGPDIDTNTVRFYVVSYADDTKATVTYVDYYVEGYIPSGTLPTPTPTPTPTPEPIVRNATDIADTWISKWNITTNYSSSTLMKVADYEGDVYNSLIEFNLPQKSDTEDVVSATLYVYTTSQSNTQSLNVCVRKMLKDWVENEVTAEQAQNGVLWEQTNAMGSNDVSSCGDEITLSEINRWYTFDVTDYVNDWYAGEANYGLMLNASTNNPSVYYAFTTRESDSNHPYIEIEFSSNVTPTPTPYPTATPTPTPTNTPTPEPTPTPSGFFECLVDNNLVDNCSFEYYTDNGSQDDFDYWEEISGGNYNASINYLIWGQHNAQISYNSGTANLIGEFDTAENEKYEFSFYVRPEQGASGETATFGLFIRDGNGGGILNNWFYEVDSNEWSLVSGYFVAQSNKTKIELTQSGNGTLYYDDVVVKSLNVSATPENPTPTLQIATITPTPSPTPTPTPPVVDKCEILDADGSTNVFYNMGIDNDSGNPSPGWKTDGEQRGVYSGHLYKINYQRNYELSVDLYGSQNNSHYVGISFYNYAGSYIRPSDSYNIKDSKTYLCKEYLTDDNRVWVSPNTWIDNKISNGGKAYIHFNVYDSFPRQRYKSYKVNFGDVDTSDSDCYGILFLETSLYSYPKNTRVAFADIIPSPWVFRQFQHLPSTWTTLKTLLVPKDDPYQPMQYHLDVADDEETWYEIPYGAYYVGFKVIENYDISQSNDIVYSDNWKIYEINTGNGCSIYPIPIPTPVH